MLQCIMHKYTKLLIILQYNFIQFYITDMIKSNSIQKYSILHF